MNQDAYSSLAVELCM